jgi:hypothetical protein
MLPANSLHRRLRILRDLLGRLLGASASSVLKLTTRSVILYLIVISSVTMVEWLLTTSDPHDAFARHLVLFKHTVALALVIIALVVDVIELTVSRRRQIQELRRQDPELFAAINREITTVIGTRPRDGKSP